MSRRLINWFNSLSVRLFLTLWLALILAHYVGYGLTHVLHQREVQAGRAGAPDVPPTPPESPSGMPPLMSLPPTDGLPAPEHLHHRFGHGPGHGSAGGMDQPWVDVLVDYGTRWIIFGVAAWLISRWVSRPLAKLSLASARLDEAISRGQAITPIDEDHGPHEMREVAQVFNHMATRLTSQFEERSLLMAAVSHDVRTPLTRLRLRLEQIESPALREAQRADVMEIDQLVGQVLDALTQERAQQSLSRVDLGAIVQAAVDDLHDMGGDIGVRGTLPELAVMAEPIALRRVLDNLMGNALRHGHRADVSVAISQTHIEVFIDDEGPGIAPAHLEAVFKPFFRLDPSRSKSTGGAGLGLYIARQLACRQGASIQLVNRPQGGLRAVLGWPLSAQV